MVQSGILCAWMKNWLNGQLGCEEIEVCFFSLSLCRRSKILSLKNRAGYFGFTKGMTRDSIKGQYVGRLTYLFG